MNKNMQLMKKRNRVYFFGSSIRPGLYAAAVIMGFVLLSACTATLMGDVTPPPEMQVTDMPFVTAQPTAFATPDVNKPDEPLEPGKIAICGGINSGSWTELPESLSLSLKVYDGDEVVSQKSQVVNGKFSYCFINIEHVDDHQYQVETEHDGLTFYTDRIQGVDIPHGGAADLTIKIYDKTQVMSTLDIERAHVFLDFSGRDMRMQVIQLFVISNHGLYAVAPPEPGEPFLFVDLPQDAFNLVLEGGKKGGRYIMTQYGFGDSEPILPGLGHHQILFSYELPYENEELMTLQMPLPTTSLTIAIPAQGVELRSDDLIDSGTRIVQGINMHLYKASDLDVGQQINMFISGWPPNARPPGGIALSNLIVGLSAFMMALIVVISWLVIKTRNIRMHPDMIEDEREEDVLDAIITLDDLYRSGEITEEAYRMRRSALKADLQNLMDKKEE